MLVAAVTWRRRLVLLAVGLVAMVVSVGWYVLLVDLWPTDSRPYIGGSTDNSFLDLVLGYNGLGRILGGEGNGGGGGARRRQRQHRLRWLHRHHPDVQRVLRRPDLAGCCPRR